MGFFVCFLESAICFAASYWVAAASHRDRSTSHRLLVAGIVALGVLYAVLQALGYASVLTALVLGLTVPAVSAVLAGLAARSLPFAELRAVLRAERDSAWRLLAELRARPDVLLLLVPAALLLIGEQLARVWALRSWAWDAVWYHHPMTSYAIQDASLVMRDAQDAHHIEGYPNGVELIGVWLDIFPRSDALEDAIQLPFVPVGVLLVYVWCRRVGARRATALGLASGWLLLPPVFLLLATGYNDVACGVLFACGVFFLSDELRARSRVLAILALSLYLASKYSAVFHIALLAPWLVAAALTELWQARGRRLRVLGSIALGLLPVVLIGLPNYLDNFIAHGNPMWPAALKVPLLDVVLPGPENLDAAYASHRAFFRGEHAFLHTLTSWWTPAAFFRPDTNEGGWGPAGRVLLLPMLLVALFDLLRGRRARETFAIVVLAVIAVCGPSTDVPRFAMGIVFAMFVATALFLSTAQRHVAFFASSALVVLLALGYREVPGHAIQPSWERVEELLGKSALERATTPLVDYHWPPELMRAKEQLPEGSVVTYDEGVFFPQEVFTHDYHTVVRFVSSNGPAADFLAKVRALDARWVLVRPNQAIERGLTAAGGRMVFTPGGTVRIYEMPPRSESTLR